MKTTRAMRKLGDDLLDAAHLTPPAEAADILAGLCGAYAGLRGGRPVEFRFASFPRTRPAGCGWGWTTGTSSSSRSGPGPNTSS